MSLTPWQRTNILGAVNYLMDASRISSDHRAEVLALGLMEVLDPSRRFVRLQREAPRRPLRERRRDGRGALAEIAAPANAANNRPLLGWNGEAAAIDASVNGEGRGRSSIVHRRLTPIF